MTYGYDLLTRRRTARNPYLRDRNLFTPGYADTADGVWWRGTDLTRGITVTVTGSQTLTETASPRPGLVASSIASISVNDLNCVLFPTTLATGQTWRTLIRLQATGNAFLMGALVMTDGTTGASNAVGSLLYHNNNGVDIRLAGIHGTLTALSSTVGDAAVASAAWWNSTYVLDLTYSAANTFVTQLRFGNAAGSEVQSSGNISKTITPTHVGVGWSNWGGTPTAPEVHFGPVYRIA